MINILNDLYGENIDIEYVLGGYILIPENILDIEVLKQEKLQDLIQE